VDDLDVAEIDETPPSLDGKSLLGGLLAEMESTAAHAGPSPTATVEVDAPSWSLRKESGRDPDTRLGSWMLLLAGLMLGLAILFVIGLENAHSNDTIRAILAGTIALGAALIVLVGRTALPKRTPESILHLRIGAPRVPAGADGSTQQTVAAATGEKAAATTTNGAATAPESQPTPAEPASGLAALLGKEPVLVQTAVLVAGVLAVAFSTDLGGTEVGGIAAGAAAALGLLTRAATTPLADPKNAAGEKLPPATEASKTGS
jgi:hypothetical protein